MQGLQIMSNLIAEQFARVLKNNLSHRKNFSAAGKQYKTNYSRLKYFANCLAVFKLSETEKGEWAGIFMRTAI